ncbi:Uncharacterised protein [Oligella ureolytica]|nr:Uncharacterised protein [Oligella ureolytica]
MRAIILIASLSLLVLTGCVHTHGHWGYDDRPRYSKKHSHNKHYNQRKYKRPKHHHVHKRSRVYAKRHHHKRR